MTPATGRLIAALAIIGLSLLEFFTPGNTLTRLTSRLKLSRTHKKHVQELALLAWLLLGAGLFLHAFVTKGTTSYAFFFAIAFLVWLNLKIAQEKEERLDATIARNALVRSVLRLSLDDLHWIGLTDATIDRLLRDQSLRAKYFRMLEDLHLDMDEILRANIPRHQLDNFSGRPRWPRPTARMLDNSGRLTGA
jgi:hypothetical protein